MLCNTCGSDQHETANCGGAIGAGTCGPADTTPNDEDLKAIGRGGGKPWSRLKKAGVALGALAVVVGLAAGVIALRSGKPAGKGKAVASAPAAPTEITLTCSLASEQVTCEGIIPSYGVASAAVRAQDFVSGSAAYIVLKDPSGNVKFRSKSPVNLPDKGETGSLGSVAFASR